MNNKTMNKKSLKLRLKVHETDNGIVLIDKSALSVEVVAYGEKDCRKPIHEAVGLAVYEEWIERKKELEDAIYGVDIEVIYKPIKKDVLY